MVKNITPRATVIGIRCSIIKGRQQILVVYFNQQRGLCTLFADRNLVFHIFSCALFFLPHFEAKQGEWGVKEEKMWKTFLFLNHGWELNAGLAPQKTFFLKSTMKLSLEKSPEKSLQTWCHQTSLKIKWQHYDDLARSINDAAPWF